MQFSPFEDFCYLFLSIVLEGAPFILLGTVFSGIIDAYLPPGLIDKWLPKNRPLAVTLSAVLGCIFPVCECAIVPVIRRLIKKGLPISCAITYMLAAPIINPITILSTMNAFSSSTNDPYKILGVKRDASDEQIKKSYEGWLKKYRPDPNQDFKSPEDKQKFSVIERSYQKIATSEARASEARMAQAMAKNKSINPSASFMTASRLFLAFLVTVAVGMILLRVRRKQILVDSLVEENEEAHDHVHDHKHCDHDHEEHHHENCGHDHDHKGHDHKAHDHKGHDNGKEGESKPNRPVLAMRTAQRDFIETGMYFTIGVAITAVFKAFVTDELILVFNQSESTGIGLMMMLAFILSLCSTSDAFIAASFPVPHAAKLAFLVYGPMMDVKLTFTYLSVFKPKFILILAVSLFFAIGILSYVWVRTPVKVSPAVPASVSI